jgi:hypothetical protein
MLLATVAPGRQSTCPVFHIDDERWSSLLKLLDVRCCSHLNFDIFFYYVAYRKLCILGLCVYRDP